MSDRNSKKSQKYSGGRNSKPVPKTDQYNTRIVQRNLVYVIGLAASIAEEEILAKEEYFGQYGKIQKTVVNKDKPFTPRGQVGPTYSAYITYSNEKEASLAILAVDGFELHNNIIKTSFGTTKYCSFYIRDQTCNNQDCLYLHSKAAPADIIDKDSYNINKEIFKEQQEAVMGHLVKVWSKYPGNKPVCDRAVLPNIASAIQIYHDYMKKHSPAKPAVKEAGSSGAGNSSTVSPQKSVSVGPSPGLAKWDSAVEKRAAAREKSPKTGEQRTVSKDEFPRLQQILPDSSRVIGNKHGPGHVMYSISEGKSVSLGEDTESSRNQSSDLPRIAIDTFPSHLVDAEGILKERFRVSLELKNDPKRSSIIKQMLDSSESEEFNREKYLHLATNFTTLEEPRVSVPPGLDITPIAGREDSPGKDNRVKEGFRLFGQNYTVSFKKRDDIYARFERRIKYKKQREAQKLAIAGKQEPKRA